jgi:putative FmdB family regulatory protein
MPTYDYVCEGCQHAFELFQAMKDEPKRKCPKCGRRKLRRLIGPGAAIVFKGSGFYQTDYRSESYKKAAAADKSNATASSSDGAKSAEGAKTSDGSKGKEKKAKK